MSIPVIFNNRQIVEPGVYARVTSGEPVKPTNFPFGATVIMDTGTYTGWGGGSGIHGELQSGANSIYSFQNLTDFKGFVKGGELFNFSDYLFNPIEGAPGPTQIIYIRANTTTAAKLDKQFTNGRLVLRAKNEGVVSNTLLDETLATVAFTLNGVTLVVANDLNIKIMDGATELLEVAFVVASTSQLANSVLVIDAINADPAGFKAKLIGNTIVITAPVGTGVDGNDYSVDVSGGDVTITGSPDFAGGVDGTELLKGVAMKMRAGDVDAAKYIFEFYLGTFRGKTDLGFYYGENNEANSKPLLLTVSTEVSSLDELLFWAKRDAELKKTFELDEVLSAVTPNGQNGLFVVGDEQDEYFEFIGGTEVYNPTDLDDALEYLREMSNTYFLCDKFGANAVSVQNEKILTSVKEDSEFERFLIIAGGKDNTKFEGSSDASIEIAQHYDSEKVIVVHSGAELTDAPNKFSEKMSALVTAFNVAGRLGGLEPQEPLTFKSLKLKKFNHILSINERKRALQAGVLHVRDVEGMGIVVNQGINSLQANTVLWNPDGKSYEISIMNISSQLNKELILNLRPLFIGGNRGRVTEADVKAAVEGYLLSQTNEDNVARLIVKFKNVNVTRVSDQFNVTYGFEPNGPINKIFTTGFMVDNIN